MTRLSNPRTRLLARLGCVILVTLGLVAFPVLGGTADPSVSIEDVTYSGDGRIVVPDSELLLWNDDAHQFTATVSARSGFDGAVCLVANGTGRTLGCANATLGANASDSVAVDVDPWPANATGPVTLDVVLRESNASARASIEAVVLRRADDTDHDGLVNRREVAIGTHPRRPDTDDDGLSDGAEVRTYGSSPLSADSDNDGLSDGAEVRTHPTDLLDPDTDGDGLLDARELALGTNPLGRDTDGDGLSDAVEVNTYGTNATLADTDGDGLDDGRELNTYRTNPRNADTDGDGLSDVLEVMTYETDPSDPDTDGDSLLDGMEVSEYRTDPTAADTDGDGLDDGAEMITHDTNPLNADTDGDGLSDGAEVNRYGTDPRAIDTDGDGTSDRLEVETGLFPDVPGLGSGPGSAVVVVVLTLGLVLTAATGGFCWATGRVPGRRALGALLGRLRAVGGRLASRRRDDPTAGAVDDGSGERPDPVADSGPPGERGDLPPDLLSNEQRVLRLLDEHDRRIRQSKIVEKTGWSKAKVSRVLSKMEADDEIVKIDVGRENVVTHPENVPSGARVEFES
jgi:hypothetical protein